MALIGVLGAMVLSVPATAGASPSQSRSRLNSLPDRALVAPSAGGPAASKSVAPAANGGWAQVNEINGGSGSGFGWAVAVSGSTMVVGAPFDNSGIGAAYVFTGSGTHWTEVQELTPSDGVANDEFGVSVAIRKSSIVVGAECHSSSGPTCAGAVYLFGESAGHWTQQVELDDPGQAANDYFGWPVAFVGKSIAVGATGEDSAQGSVFVYAAHRNVWSEQGGISDPGAQAGDLFGSGLAVSGKKVVIGAPGTNGSAGAAYTFSRAGTGWVKSATLTASNGEGCSSTCGNGLGYVYGDYFGDSVAIKGKTVVVGAPYASVVPAPDGVGTGTAYVFTRSGSHWAQNTEVSEPSEVSAGVQDAFGFQVGLLGSTVIAAAPDDYQGAGNYANGAAFILPKVGKTWPDSTPYELTASDGVGGDYFGWSGLTTIGTDVIVVGSPYSSDGGLYFFQN
jgi:hypothetical protein